jgi:predicted NUDIX family NTP pyrophosphohydrolase
VSDHRRRPRTSAGILLYRRTADVLEVLLGHPGGPWFAAKDLGHWSIPKGEVDDGEEDDHLAVARREFREETGHDAPDDGFVALGSIRQAGGKLVEAWAAEGDLDPALAHSNMFSMEWPRGTGQTIQAPEIDRVAWFTLPAAHEAIVESQRPLLERLGSALLAATDEGGHGSA